MKAGSIARTSLVLVGLSATISPPARAQFTQQGPKLVGSGWTGNGAVNEGASVAISADGNTAIIGGPQDGSPDLGDSAVGAAWVFTRNNGFWTQQGSKLVGTGCVAEDEGGCNQGTSIALSADGNTALSGGRFSAGVSVFIRNGSGAWSQQAQIAGSGAPVALSADGNTALFGTGCSSFSGGGPCVYTRNAAGVWSRQAGLTVVPVVPANNPVASLLTSAVALSADGNTAIVGVAGDNNSGAVWVFTRSGTTWTQQGPKLVGSGATGGREQGASVSISADGNTILEGDPSDSPNLAYPYDAVGAAWVFTRNGAIWTQQGNKLVGTGSFRSGASQGMSVAVSADGNTAAVGGPGDNFSRGGVWMFTRKNETWSQQGNKLVGTGAIPSPSNAAAQGSSVALSADAGTLIEGGPSDNYLTGNLIGGPGAAWVFTQPGANSHFSISAPASVVAGAPVNLTVTALDANNNTFGAYSGRIHFTSSDTAAILPSDTVLVNGVGSFQATLNTAESQTITATDTALSSLTGTSSAIFVTGSAAVLGATGNSAGVGSGYNTTMSFTFSDSAGFRDLRVVDVLINSALDGREACYLAYLPSSGFLFLVDDFGNAGGPFAGGATFPGSGTVHNSQCTVSGSASGSGNTLTLTLNFTFASSFAGNKVIYLGAVDQFGATSNWQAMATWNIPGAALSGPSVTGMSPARSSSLGPTLYTFTFADTGGFRDAGSVENILINSVLDGRRACYLSFVPGTNSLLLVDDAGDAAGPYQGLVLPSNGSIGNGQCAINGAGSSVSRNGNALALTLSITFSAAFAGNQVFYLAAYNGTGNSNWQAVGSVSIP
jgi:hypothetical protein